MDKEIYDFNHDADDNKFLPCKSPSSHPRLRILFICTAHNSLSQRLYLVLSADHDVTVEYALSAELMISAAEIFKPDVILCPFLTSKVPQEVYDKYMTLIVHPGPPGDAGPSALDWVLMGDDGALEDATDLLKALDSGVCNRGRPFWGVSVLQAIEKFDEGPIWAYEQFPIDIDTPGLTKSELYRGAVTRAAVSAAVTAIDRIVQAALLSVHGKNSSSSISPNNSEQLSLKTTHGLLTPPELDNELEIQADLQPDPSYAILSVGAHKPFLGGFTRHRPLLKPAQRTFDTSKHSAQFISRRLRSADSQPGVMSDAFGIKIYLYGGIIEDQPFDELSKSRQGAPEAVQYTFGKVLGTREGAICLETADQRGIWITHIRRPKRKIDKALWPKVPALEGLIELGIMGHASTSWPIGYTPRPYLTFQDITISYVQHSHGLIAYLSWNFYNGAMTTPQCRRLLSALDVILAQHSGSQARQAVPIVAVVLQGGSYFSNGIALNTIEASKTPADESWANINAINDIVFSILYSFAAKKIITVAAIRGNTAAGGVAMAAACDVVLCAHSAVLNPAYRGVGLFGSEYHSISYPGRCGISGAKRILHDMIPLSASQGQAIGLVDRIIAGHGAEQDSRIKTAVDSILCGTVTTVDWKIRPVKTVSGPQNLDLSVAGLAKARAYELGEMSKDFWSARRARFEGRRWNFVRKVVPKKTPLRFAKHRRGPGDLDEEEQDTWANVQYWEEKALFDILATRIDPAVQTTHSTFPITLKRADTADSLSSQCKPKPVIPTKPVTLHVDKIPESKEHQSSDQLTPDDSPTLFHCYYGQVAEDKSES